MFLYSILTYYQLVPEVFMADGFVSQEKLVQFAMSFMSKDAAAQWAERRASAVPFPFPTWALGTLGTFKRTMLSTVQAFCKKPC
jgi:hypothetical protein